MDKISIIVPCFNEEKTLPLFYEELTKTIHTFGNTEFEFLFINDGSSDNTLEIIKQLLTTDSRVKYLSFSRNFGKEAAILAGLEHATGDFITIMDADLQDPPALLKEMYESVTKENYDAVRNAPNGPQRRTSHSQFFCQNVLSHYSSYV